AEMLEAGTDATSYQLSLVQVSVPQHALSFSTNYNESFLKSRVVMMNTKKSSASSSWKYLLLLPVLLLSVLSLNATQIEVNDHDLTQEQGAITSAEPVTAGPKGIPAGAEDLPTNERGEVSEENPWNKVHRETITREFAAGKNMALDVHNITGAIKVVGYAGDKIKVTVEKVIKATSDKDLQLGIEEVQMGAIEQRNHLYLYHESPYTDFSPGTKHFQVSDCGGNCYNYQFYLHYQVMVPHHMNLMLSTINGGDIHVQQVEGEKIEARHISGSVYMTEVAGVQEVYTISGHIEVSFTKNPTTVTSFVSTSGHVSLDLQEGFGGEISFSSISGKLHSSFPVNGKRLHEGLGNEHSPVKVGNGGARMEIRSVSGNLFLE
ncbi:MAG: DUF4097 family beta strand repeat-containing protein, partial [Bacteroidota bacterium]